MKNAFVLFLLFFTSLNVFALTIEEIEKELSTLSTLKQRGITGPEIDSRESFLKAEKEKLQGKDKNYKQSAKSQKTNKKSRPQDDIDFLRNIEDENKRLLAITEALQEERTALALAINSSKRNEQAIQKLRDKIDLLEAEKIKIESKIVKSSVENRISNLKAGAMFDFYYGISNNEGNGNNTSNPNDDTNSLRYYDNIHSDFALNLAELTLSAAVKKTSFLIDIDFGEFSEQNSTDSVTKHIGQAHVTYDIDGKHSVNAGKMYTHVGYELAKPIDNWNYSRSYTFGYGGPFWHEGVALKGAYENGIRWGLYIYDAWDTRRDTNSEKTYGAQLGWASGQLAVIYNYINGAEQTDNESNYRTVHELNAQYNFTSNFSLALDTLMGVDENAAGTDKDQKWRAVALYGNWKYSDKWRFALREEWFSENTQAGATTYKLGFTGPVNVTSHTLTISYSLAERNEIRFEQRLDNASEKIYTDRGNQTNSTQNTSVLSWMLAI
jgi:hypothetical protein